MPRKYNRLSPPVRSLYMPGICGSPPMNFSLVEIFACTLSGLKHIFSTPYMSNTYHALLLRPVFNI